MALCTSPSMHRPTNPVPFATLHRQSPLSLVYLSKVNEFVEVICGDMTANAPWRRQIKIASNGSVINCCTLSQSASGSVAVSPRATKWRSPRPMRVEPTCGCALGCFQMPHSSRALRGRHGVSSDVNIVLHLLRDLISGPTNCLAINLRLTR